VVGKDSGEGPKPDAPVSNGIATAGQRRCGSDLGDPLVRLVEGRGVLGQQRNQEVLAVRREVVDERRDALGVDRLQRIQ